MTAYEMRKYCLSYLLEEYRATPPNTRRKKAIDSLINTSLACAADRQDKQYHNLIVLRYIADVPPSKSRICKALHISRSNYEEVTENAIRRLLIIAFGIDGIEWSGQS